MAEGEQLACLWREENLKNFLIEKIMEKKIKEQIDFNKKITENLLIDEFWLYWMELPETESVKKIMNHPALSKNDHETIFNIIMEEKKKQVYTTLACSALSYIIYSLSLKKSRFFYNFFRKKSRFRAWPYMKRGFISITYVLLCFKSLDYIFDKRIPVVINDKGLFKKYTITFKE